MELVLRTIIFLTLGFMGGCSWVMGDDPFFEETEYDYSNAQMTAELQVPESIGQANIQDHFLVPELSDGDQGVVYGTEKEIMAPMQVLTLGNKFRVNRAAHSSVYITDTEIKLWDKVERYLEQENITIRNKDLETGTIVTGWLVKEDDSFWSSDITAWRYRYQIKLSSADRPSENVLTITILDAQELLAKTGKWQKLADDGRNETEFLNSILGFIYVENISNSRQRVNQSGLGGLTVTLGSDSNGNPALITSANFEHLWSRIPLSLKLLNITVEDRDRSQKAFYIKNNEEGFFDSLAFWSSDGGSALDLPEVSYRIQLADKGDRISITFFDQEDNPLDANVLAKNFPTLSKAFRSRITE